MNPKILSICIPTYNREKLLRSCIESIVHQKGFNAHIIEICITDNASTDGTESMIAEYQETYGNFSYYKNSENVGMTANFLRAIENGSGEYVWLFGSDDMMTEIALESTLETIRKEKPSLILSDRHVFSDEKVDANPHLFTGKTDLIFGEPEDFIKHLGDDNKENGRMNGNFFTFISIFCMKKELYTKNKIEFLEKYGKKYTRIDKNYFNYSIIPFFNLHHEKIVIIKSKTLVLCRGWNHGWSFDNMDIFKDLFFSLKTFFLNYKITPKCGFFLGHMLFGWFIPSVAGIVKKHPLLRKIYKPLAFIMKPFV